MCAVYGYTRAPWAAREGGVTQCVVNWGANLAESGHLGFAAILRAKEAGAKLVVVDPGARRRGAGGSVGAASAGRTGRLALGMIHVIIEEGLYDEIRREVVPGV